MTAPRTPVEALAIGLRARYDHHIPDAQLQDVARVALAHLPSGWHLISEDTLAERLHQDCLDTIARREAARPGGQYTLHMPDAHLDEARRLLGGRE